MFTIKKEFHFSAAHQLHGLPEEHPCSRLHGHNYVLTLFLKSPTTDSVGFVQDYRELDSIKKYIDDTLDHRNLNDLFEINTTVENMCKVLFDIFKQTTPLLFAIEMSETPKTNCRYEPN
jgi:6-pyruvoyltetrahydropterin/6-carboxytetrahydropterin synthase